MQRPRASGGVTIHLAPGEHRQWTFSVGGPSSQYAVEVTYSNDNIGDTETLSLSLDGVPLGAFDASDTGDDGEGWNVFVTNIGACPTWQPEVTPWSFARAVVTAASKSTR